MTVQPVIDIRRISPLLHDEAMHLARTEYERLATLLDSLTEDDVDQVIDQRYTPPVTVGIRLSSVLVETSQHIGQAGYVRGLRERRLGINSGWAGTA